MTTEKTPDTIAKETPETNTVGRPSGITPEFLGMAKAYLEKYETLGEIIPTIEGLALFTDKARVMLHRWVRDKESKEFSYIYSKLMALQGKALLNNGLAGKYNSTITKLILTKHDYRDARDERHGDPNGDPLKINVINYANSNDTIPVQAKKTSAGVSTEQSKIQDSGVSQESGKVNDGSERTDKEGSNNT